MSFIQWRRFRRGEFTKSDILKKFGAVFAVIIILALLWANATNMLSAKTKIIILCLITFLAGGGIGIIVGQRLWEANDDSHRTGYIVVGKERPDGSLERVGGFWYHGVISEMRWTDGLFNGCEVFPLKTNP